MKIRSLKLQDEQYGDDWATTVEDHWDYDDFIKEPRWRDGWISFDCALHVPEDDRVYCGITCFNENSIFQAFDRKTDAFVDLGYSRVADFYDAKFHRSLVRSADGTMYAAAALLHCGDHYMEAPGSPIIRYRPDTGELERDPPPLPHVYIQAIALDDARQTLYGVCFPPEYLIAYDLRTKETRTLSLIGSGIGGMTQSENLVIDDDGCLWSTWSLTRAWQNNPGPDIMRLCKYDPTADKMVYFQAGLPHPDGAHGYVKPEAYFNFGDGYIYASGGSGSLYRIDTATGEATFLFTPTTGRPSRLTSLVKAEDGVAYGITGREGQCELMRVHYADGTFETLGPIVDADGIALWQCHDTVLTPDGVLYLCENDNPYRSGYLWEVAGLEAGG